MCGLCGFVCPVNHPPEKYFPKECYAVTVKSERELFSCASGGAATAIARHVLNTGGVVYGCSGWIYVTLGMCGFQGWRNWTC